MIALQVFFCCTIIAIAYQILIMPGELLQSYARFVNLNFNDIFKKLLMCPYCFGGQLALWASIVLISMGHGIEVLMSVPCTIVAVYFIVKHNFR